MKKNNEIEFITNMLRFYKPFPLKQTSRAVAVVWDNRLEIAGIVDCVVVMHGSKRFSLFCRLCKQKKDMNAAK